MKHKILLCDDEVHILRAAEFKLVRCGFDVVCASDGQEAWEIIQRQPPDLVVTDCQMPRLNGLQLVEKIRGYEPTRDLHIVMLTAKGLELPFDELSQKWRVAALLSKPFSPRELSRCVEQVLAGEKYQPVMASI
jgi:two-component system alkaline phosphatase synthesis response regulator PhoP